MSPSPATTHIRSLRSYWGVVFTPQGYVIRCEGKHKKELEAWVQHNVNTLPPTIADVLPPWPANGQFPKTDQGWREAHSWLIYLLVSLREEPECLFCGAHDFAYSHKTAGRGQNALVFTRNALVFTRTESGRYLTPKEIQNLAETVYDRGVNMAEKLGPENIEGEAVGFLGLSHLKWAQTFSALVRERDRAYYLDLKFKLIYLLGVIERTAPQEAK